MKNRRLNSQSVQAPNDLNSWIAQYRPEHLPNRKVGVIVIYLTLTRSGKARDTLDETRGRSFSVNYPSVALSLVMSHFLFLF